MAGTRNQDSLHADDADLSNLCKSVKSASSACKESWLLVPEILALENFIYFCAAFQIRYGRLFRQRKSFSAKVRDAFV